jgi:fibro-slime domain-containing protein
VNGLGEILWWQANQYVSAGTSYSWPTTVTLPFDVTSNLFPNGPSGSNGGTVGYIATHLQATFTAPAGGTVTFNLGSDDDSFIYLNGTLVADYAGIHGFTNISFPVTTGLIDGVNKVDVFQVDRQTVQSGLYFDANVTLNSVPEPSTWAMMGLGFAALGFAGHRARKTSISIA